MITLSEDIFGIDIDIETDVDVDALGPL